MRWKAAGRLLEAGCVRASEQRVGLLVGVDGQRRMQGLSPSEQGQANLHVMIRRVPTWAGLRLDSRLRFHCFENDLENG